MWKLWINTLLHTIHYATARQNLHKSKTMIIKYKNYNNKKSKKGEM